MGGDTNVSHEFDEALCGVTVENAALSLSLVGYSWSIPSNSKTTSTSNNARK